MDNTDSSTCCALFQQTTVQGTARRLRQAGSCQVCINLPCKAHRLLAQHQPSLPIPRREPCAIIVWRTIHGGDFVEGMSPASLTRAQFEQVTKAIRLLHENGFVSGKLRLPSILVKDEKVSIMDFNWCGEAGESCYPAC
jgi:hypothetical protein